MPSDPEPNAAARSQFIERAAAFFFTFAAAGVLAIGLLKSLNPLAGGDLLLRHTEMQYIRHGINPNDVALTWHAENGSPLRGVPYRPSEIRPDLGEPATLGLYPPSSYATLMPLGWMPFNRAKWVFVAFNTIAALTIGVLVFRVFKKQCSVPLSVAAAASTVANYGNARTIWMGQLGILTTLAALTALLLIRRRPAAAGMAIAIALVKPTLTLPPALAPYIARVRGRHVCIGAAIVLLVAASLAVCDWTATTPPIWLRQFLALGRIVSVMGSWAAVPRVLTVAGLSPELSSEIGVAVLAATTSILIWAAWPLKRAAEQTRANAMLLCAAAGAVAARITLYHAGYDDVILALLVPSLPLLVRRPSRILAAVCLLWITVALPLGLLGDETTLPGRLWTYGYEGFRVIV